MKKSKIIVGGIFMVVALAGYQLISVHIAKAATYTVTSNANAGAGTLRQAILDANASVGVTDTIVFAIGTGQQSIAPTAALPTITDPVVIDGTTQPGGATCGTSFSSRVLLIEINGTNAGNNPNLQLVSGSSGSTIKGIVTNRAGSSAHGIRLEDSDNNTLQCNNIGTNFAGTSGYGNQSQGIQLTSNTSGNTIGGTGAGEGNLISGNADGISIGVGGDSNTIVGNWIGLGSDGGCIGNADGQGIAIAGNNNQVGGSTTAARNIVSCHSSESFGDGIDISAFGTVASGNKIQGNWVGTNTSGQIQTGYGNQGVAMAFFGTVQNNLIGGVNSGEGNLLAGNDAGIVNVSAEVPLGSPAINNSIVSNSIYGNSGGELTSLGIDLVYTDDFSTYLATGVTPNDAGDPDSNSNHFMNFPVISSVSSSNGQVTITYSLDINNSEAGATGYRIEFFANDASDPSGYGEGQTFLGYQNVAGDVTGQSVTFTLPAGVEGNKFVSATTTMIDSSTDGFGHTSEFGALVESNFVPTGSITPAPATLAPTGNSALLLFCVSALFLLTGGAGFYIASRR